MEKELISKFQAMTNEVLTEDEKKIMGIGTRAAERERLDIMVENGVDTDAIRSYNRPGAPHPLSNIQGKDSDGEIVFFFEDGQDAEDMFSFFVDSKLLEAGEIMIRHIEGQSSVAFMPNVVIQKPEMIQAALIAYEDQMYFEDEKDEEAFESLIVNMTDVLTEAPNKSSGAPKRRPEMGNPFHNKKTGEFSGIADHAGSKGGSWAYKKTKLKFTGKGKTKEGGLLGKYGSTKHPCGRAARENGKDVRCWDGQQMGGGGRVAKALGKKKGKKEDLNIADLSVIMEMRSKYKV